MHEATIAACTMCWCKSSGMLCSVDQLSDFTLELCISCLHLNSVVVLIWGQVCSCLDSRECDKSHIVDICVTNRRVVCKYKSIFISIMYISIVQIVPKYCYPMLCCVNALLLPVNVTLYLCVVFVYSISLCTVLVCVQYQFVHVMHMYVCMYASLQACLSVINSLQWASVVIIHS